MAITDKFTRANNGSLASPATLMTSLSPSDTTATLSLSTGWPQDGTHGAVHFTCYKVDPTAKKPIDGTQVFFKATLTGTTLSNIQRTGGSMTQSFGLGDPAIVYFTPGWANDLIDGLLVAHNANGTPKKVTGFYEPTGKISMFGGVTAPDGYLLCNGSAISRTTYADLFGVIGTLYGAGDGTATFNLPNMKGRVPVGLDPSDTDFDTLGKTGGHKLLQAHTHNFSANQAYQLSNSQTYSYATPGDTQPRAIFRDGAWNTITSTGGGNSQNLQPFTTVNYVIKS
jgi:microcystin-dependent protein